MDHLGNTRTRTTSAKTFRRVAWRGARLYILNCRIKMLVSGGCNRQTRNGMHFVSPPRSVDVACCEKRLRRPVVLIKAGETSRGLATPSSRALLP